MATIVVLCPAKRSRDLSEILSRRKQSTAQQLFPAALAYFLRPNHPASLAQAEKMPCILVRREAKVVEPEKHHARRPVRSVERLLPCQREVRDPLVEPRTDIRKEISTLLDQWM